MNCYYNPQFCDKEAEFYILGDIPVCFMHFYLEVGQKKCKFGGIKPFGCCWTEKNFYHADVHQIKKDNPK